MSEHWTDTHFRLLGEKGFKYGFLRHSGSTASDTPASAFIGYNNLNELYEAQQYSEEYTKQHYPNHTLFYGIAVAEDWRKNGTPPHHHFMVYHFPKSGVDARWYVLGYVVELERYNKQPDKTKAEG